jgi:catechol 2,3-dioxygenase-like lactoylglutathione lyase family enzyme
MSTIDHVTIRVSDFRGSSDFYERVFTNLEIAEASREAGSFIEWGDFSLTESDAEHAPTRGLHIAFSAASRELVERWWRALTAAGYRDDGPPGLRPQYSPDYYGAFVLDAQGNSVEAVSRGRTVGRPNGSIDHLWVRAAELDPIKRFYAAVAPTLGLQTRDDGEYFRLIAAPGGCTFLDGPPTASLHLAIGVGDRETVSAFHAAAIAAGGRDNGAPGERPHYHPGYYGAFVFDPANVNLEAVFHDRGRLAPTSTAT